MILTVDIGNTNITCGLFDGKDLTKTFRLKTDNNLDVNDYIELLFQNIGDIMPEGAIIASVVEELNNRIQYAILAQYGIKAHILTSDSKLPIKLLYKNNSQLGADRIANGTRGYNLYQKAVIVVDLGTATTFDVINSNGEFIGGLIAPGINTQLNSLNTSTSKLPTIQAKKINTAIGTTTTDAILSGVVKGTACMVDGMIMETKKELNEEPAIILTGGFSELISEYMQTSVDEIAPHLTLEGLNDVFYLNKPVQPIF